MWSESPGSRAARRAGWGTARREAILVVAASLLPLLGCAVSRLPQVDLSETGWTVRTGQAIWRPGRDRPPVAGDLILARHANGDVLVNFSKPPLSIFTARTAGRRWTIDFVAQKRSHSGRGAPPRRFVWFFVPQVVEGATPPDGWSAAGTAGGSWKLEHVERGETIEVVLDP